MPRNDHSRRRRLMTAVCGGLAAALAITGFTVGLDRYGGPGPAPVSRTPGPSRTPYRMAVHQKIHQKAGRPLVVNGRRQPPKVTVPEAGKGRYAVVPGISRPPGGAGRIVRYLVEVERGLPFPAAGFAAAVHRTLNDPRGWGRGGKQRFHRVAAGPVEFRVSLTSPSLAGPKCLPLWVGNSLSCFQRGRAVINARRWAQGATTYGKDLASYREYVVNHEVGHGLGHQHAGCPGHGKRAPVMVQQTKSLYGCRPNPWPHPRVTPSTTTAKPPRAARMTQRPG